MGCRSPMGGALPWGVQDPYRVLCQGGVRPPIGLQVPHGGGFCREGVQVPCRGTVPRGGSGPL